MIVLWWIFTAIYVIAGLALLLFGFIRLFEHIIGMDR